MNKLSHARRVVTPILLALGVAGVVGCDEAPATAPTSTVPRERLGALSNTLRDRLVAARFFTAVAIDSLPIGSPGAQRVRVEFRALNRVADSLAFVTALEREAWRASCR